MQHKRKERVGDQIRKEVSYIIQSELKDPGIGFVTITDVELSEDLKSAKIFYSVFGDEKNKLDSSRALQRAIFFVQREIGKRMRLKYTPKIRFIFDDSVERGARIEKTLEELRSSETKEEKDDN
jgi:ribosome-binding factor A